MGFRDLVLFYVVTGVSLRWIATAAAAGPSSIVIWIGAWLVFYTPLALSVIELSSRYPEEGGIYVWAKRGFGDFSGFISGLDLLGLQPALLPCCALLRRQQRALHPPRLGPPFEQHDVLHRLLSASAHAGHCCSTFLGST